MLWFSSGKYGQWESETQACAGVALADTGYREMSHTFSEAKGKQVMNQPFCWKGLPDAATWESQATSKTKQRRCVNIQVGAMGPQDPEDIPEAVAETCLSARLSLTLPIPWLGLACLRMRDVEYRLQETSVPHAGRGAWAKATSPWSPCASIDTALSDGLTSVTGPTLTSF